MSNLPTFEELVEAYRQFGYILQHDGNDYTIMYASDNFSFPEWENLPLKEVNLCLQRLLSHKDGLKKFFKIEHITNIIYTRGKVTYYFNDKDPFEIQLNEISEISFRIDRYNSLKLKKYAGGDWDIEYEIDYKLHTLFNKGFGLYFETDDISPQIKLKITEKLLEYIDKLTILK